jgi:hypothetical protein
MIETAPTDTTSRPRGELVLRALEKAAELAAAGDAEGAVRTILNSGYPNRLVNGRLADRYSRVPRDVRTEAVAEGIASLHTAITKGTPVPRPGGYLLKVADRICAQEQRRQEQQATMDGISDRDLLNELKK